MEHYEGEVHPFMIGDIDPGKGLIHVFDDVTLDILLSTLTTTADFLSYLTKKEAFIRSGRLVIAAGEEELLAHYLKNINEQEEHDFIVPAENTHIGLDEGIWDDFIHSDARVAQLEADRGSYLWDRLIEHLSGHVLNGTAIGDCENPFSNHEQAIRWFAREGRTARRVLSMSLRDLLENTPSNPRIRKSRIIPPLRNGSPYYTFLLLGRPPGKSDEEYREFRLWLLETQCMAVKLRFPDATDIVGFATEPLYSGPSSEDYMYLDARVWTPDMEADAKARQSAVGMFSTLTEAHRVTVMEYPSTSA